jgi:GGDEF domain-containing protein
LSVNEQYDVLILAPSAETCQRIEGVLRHSALQTRTQAAALGEWGRVDLGDADLVVIDWPSGQDAENIEIGTGGARRPPLLVLAKSPSVRTRSAFIRAGAAEVLSSPADDTDILYEALHALRGEWRSLQLKWTDEQWLGLLKQLTALKHDIIAPVLNPERRLGHSYPDVSPAVPPGDHDRDCLERLASLGFLSREIQNRVRVCPSCFTGRLNFREVCPQCQSVRFHQQDIINCFRCGRNGPVSEFRQGGKLVCPKCSHTLRHIGVDYEKPSYLNTCLNCDHMFPEAFVQVQCLHCGESCEPMDTIDTPIYNYELTPLVQQAIYEGSLAGSRIENVLRNDETGVYSRSFFEFELERERVRASRYHSPFSLLMLRIEGFSALAAQQPGESQHYADSIFQAVSHDLRPLDTTCIWDEDILAILLPSTPPDRAKVLSQRIYETVTGLEFLYSIGKPEVAISMTSSAEGEETGEALINAAMQDLQT